MDSLLTASKPMTLNTNINQKNEDDFLNNLMGSNNNNKNNNDLGSLFFCRE